MDYMSDLPSTKHGNDCVFMVVDQLSKMAILTTCKKNITIEATRKLFFENIWAHFGLISDWDNRFLSTFGPTYGHYWTPSSPNPLPSITKLMA